MPWVQAASPHGPVISTRPLPRRKIAVLAVVVAAVARVADLMQEQHALPPSVNVTELAREMTAR